MSTDVHVFCADPFMFPLPTENCFPVDKYGLLRERIEPQLVIASRRSKAAVRLCLPVWSRRRDLRTIGLTPTSCPYGRNFLVFLSLYGRYSSITKLRPHLASACCSARFPIFSIFWMAFCHSL